MVITRTTASEADYINNCLGHLPIEDLEALSRGTYNHVYMAEGMDLYDMISGYLLVQKVMKRWVRRWVRRRRKLKAFTQGENVIFILREREIGIF